jgi:hypothetical protein
MRKVRVEKCDVSYKVRVEKCKIMLDIRIDFVSLWY